MISAQSATEVLVPPSGEHRYFFRLYALDAPTGLKPGATKAQLPQAMESHILAHAELIGKYNEVKVKGMRELSYLKLHRQGKL